MGTETADKDRKRLLGVYGQSSDNRRLHAQVALLQQEFDFDFDLRDRGDETYQLGSALAMVGSRKYSACLLTSLHLAVDGIPLKVYANKGETGFDPRRYAGLQVVEHAAHHRVPSFVDIAYIHDPRIKPSSLLEKIKELGGIPFSSKQLVDATRISYPTHKQDLTEIERRNRERSQRDMRKAYDDFMRRFEGVFPRKDSEKK